VTRTADPQVVPPGASQVVHGAQAVASEARTFRVGASRAQVAAINGQPGIVIRSARGLQLAMIFRIARGRVVHFDVVADSHRLAHLRIDD
jgi:RNA polymerase sigma-70 factor (ECF subfamily)